MGRLPIGGEEGLGKRVGGVSIEVETGFVRGMYRCDAVDKLLVSFWGLGCWDISWTSRGRVTLSSTGSLLRKDLFQRLRVYGSANP